MTEQPAAQTARRYTRDGDVITCHDHGERFTMGVIAGLSLPTSCKGCDAAPPPSYDAAVTPLLPSPPDGCFSTVVLEADAVEVVIAARTARLEMVDLAGKVGAEITELRKNKVKSSEYYRELLEMAEMRIRLLAEARKQGDLQIKANRRAGDYAARREDDYLTDRRDELMGGGSH